MSKVKAGPVAADRLKSFIDRVEKLEEERKAISGDIRDVYAEAKGVGYDVKTMRKIIQIRKQDAAERDEQEALLDVYKHALGMDTFGHSVPQTREPTEDELMDAAGRIAGEVDQCLALALNGDIPKIADIQRLIGCSAGKASKLRRMTVERAEALVEISRSSAFHRENAETGSATVVATGGEGCGPGAPPAEDSGHAPEPATTPAQSASLSRPQPDAFSTDDVEIEGLSDETARKFNVSGPPVATSTHATGRPPGEGEDDDARHLTTPPEVAGPVPPSTCDGDLEIPVFLDRRNKALAPAQKPEHRGCSVNAEGTQ